VKKWTIIAAILICCVLYALVKFSKPQGQNETNPAADTPIEEQVDAGDPNKAPLAENPGSAVPPTVVEAVIKDWKKFQSCLKEEDYKQAWELTTEHFKSVAVHGGFEGFKETAVEMEMATLTIHPESACYIDDEVALRVTGPSLGGREMYFMFIEEDGQWKLLEGHSP
jgi:hypothetical protein